MIKFCFEHQNAKPSQLPAARPCGAPGTVNLDKGMTLMRRLITNHLQYFNIHKLYVKPLFLKVSIAIQRKKKT